MIEPWGTAAINQYLKVIGVVPVLAKGPVVPEADPAPRGIGVKDPAGSEGVTVKPLPADLLNVTVPPRQMFTNCSDGGQGGIRTHGKLSPTTVFKTVALNHSATCPRTPTPLAPCGAFVTASVVVSAHRRGRNARLVARRHSKSPSPVQHGQAYDSAFTHLSVSGCIAAGRDPAAIRAGANRWR